MSDMRGFRACVLPTLSCYFQLHVINDALTTAIWLLHWGAHSGCEVPKVGVKACGSVHVWGAVYIHDLPCKNIKSGCKYMHRRCEVCWIKSSAPHVLLWLKWLGTQKNYSGAKSCFYTINPCKNPTSSEFTLHILVWPKGIWKTSI